VTGALLSGAQESDTLVTEDRNAGQTRHLLVDISVIARNDAGTGIQRVVREIYSRLANAVPSGWAVVPVRACRLAGYREVKRAELFERFTANDDVTQAFEPSSGDVFLGLDLAANVLPRHRRQLRDWKAKGVRIHIVLYDLLPLQKPAWFPWRTRLRFRRWLGVTSADARQVLCISRAVASEYAHWLSRSILFRWRQPPAIVHFPLGSDFRETATSATSQGRAHVDEALSEWCAAGRTLIIVGTVEPRKGHAVLLDAMDAIWRNHPESELKLLVVGRRGWKTRAVQQRLDDLTNNTTRVLWREGVDDTTLARLYRQVAGLVIPSFGEGFGLPLVEAVACGLPVLARDLPVFRETVGDRVTYFVDDRAEQLSKSILDWLSNPKKPEGPPLPTWAESVTRLVERLQLTEPVG
jgi:glycosyltransferase involved in cell wall biosynthesis